MAMELEQETPQSGGPLNLRQTLLLGIKTLGSEVYWNLLRLLREVEIKQLDKRLLKEYETLGRLHAGQGEPSAEDRESEEALCRKQIDFLEKEIAFLREELEKLRTTLIQERLERWNLRT